MDQNQQNRNLSGNTTTPAVETNKTPSPGDGSLFGESPPKDTSGGDGISATPQDDNLPVRDDSQASGPSFLFDLPDDMDFSLAPNPSDSPNQNNDGTTFDFSGSGFSNNTSGSPGQNNSAGPSGTYDAPENPSNVPNQNAQPQPDAMDFQLDENPPAATGDSSTYEPTFDFEPAFDMSVDFSPSMLDQFLAGSSNNNSATAAPEVPSPPPPGDVISPGLLAEIENNQDPVPPPEDNISPSALLDEIARSQPPPAQNPPLRIP
ncbi:hypothetical protein O1611_g2658 [Lasiodiplodia mahajangana]|uniref:Uncharacterized protein n=1 Tax=Lasiodiplodia mahajangana TaxID=1108764 RepID=A0ACC2JUG5_9PEZI|nr:hypothetical protein O1611_g2658 [Lasiodiplodia mahajangana]